MSARSADTNTRRKPTVISTFAGVGGSSLGYKWAGFRELLAIDFDKNAVKCFMLNFPGVTVWERPIQEVTGEMILKECGIAQGELDVLDGSPPCQGFSMSGRRAVTDKRNDLFKEYVRMINELKPRVFVMENVTGMAKGKMRGMFIGIMKSLKSTGYRVECKQMNSQHYGVPQSRPRLIFIGVRNDLNKGPAFPEPNSRIITTEEAIGKIDNSGEEIMKPRGMAAKLAPMIRPGGNGSAFNAKRHHYSLYRASYKKPVNTVLKLFAAGMSGTLHPRENRFLTIKELKVLCSFPENFKLAGSFKDKWARMGNAVMPKFMEAIAKTIKKELL